MTTMYSDGSRRMQERFDSQRLADRMKQRIVRDSLSPEQQEYLAGLDCFFLATADAAGRPTCSYKGGDPGFLRCVDDRTVAFPCYDGNGMFLSMGNVLENPEVGMLFVDFERGSRMRIQGTATIDPDDPLLAEFPEAQLIVRVAVREAFPNCPRYVHRRTLVDRSEFVPRDGCETPVPDWKRSPLASDVLPAGDPAAEVS